MYRLIVSLLVYQTLALNEHQYTISKYHFHHSNVIKLD